MNSTKELDRFELFDAHLHIIDSRFPLQENNGYLPGEFTVTDYLRRLTDYELCGGAVVSGSFQGFDQSYLAAALEQLGKGFVGVTQLPHSVSDAEILELDAAGIRALRFNLRRGGSAPLRELETMAARVFEIARWHTELYVDSTLLAELTPRIKKLPAVSIDHLGLSELGFDSLKRLVASNVKVKACGFGRVDFPVAKMLKDLYAANPNALMFGSDLPSTRAPRPYIDDDYRVVVDSLGEEGAGRVLSDNAKAFYRIAV